MFQRNSDIFLKFLKIYWKILYKRISLLYINIIYKRTTSAISKIFFYKRIFEKFIIVN